MEKEIERAAWRLAAAIAQEDSEFLLFWLLHPDLEENAAYALYENSYSYMDEVENNLIHALRKFLLEVTAYKNMKDMKEQMYALIGALIYLDVLPVWAIVSAIRRTLDSLP